MAGTKIVIPDFQFSGFYYPEILQRVRVFNRINAPEISTEEPEDPFIQAERAFSLVGHYNNVLLDFVAKEMLPDTLTLQDSARKVFRIIAYQLQDYAPATVELLLTLTQVFTVSTRILDALSVFETFRTEETEAVPFENLEAIDAGPTDEVSAAYGLTLDRSGADGQTVAGDADVFESATAAFTAGDIGDVLEIEDSILGSVNNYLIVERISATRARLAGLFGQPNPFFLVESGLSWKIRKWSADGAAALNAAGTFSPFAAGMAAGDAFYFSQEFVLWDAFDVVLNTPGANFSGVWEYYDPDTEDETPDLVTNLGTQLRFNLNTLLGVDNASGAFVRVTHLPTGNYEILKSTWDGSDNQATTSAFLGQSGTPSTDVDDYAVSSLWLPLPDIDDGTAVLTGDGQISYTLPQTERKNWQKVTVQNLEAHWLRFRVVTVGGATLPILDSVDVTPGAQYVLASLVQGETVQNEPLVSSNGQDDQEFLLSQTPGLRDTVECYVDEGGGEVEWVNVTALGDRLITSGPTDRHFAVEQNSLGELTVRFGNGTNGKVPALGVDNVRFVYRIRAAEDGNVGAGTVEKNVTGAAFVSAATNPRPASGWREAEGASEESLAVLKEEGPASTRTRGAATGASDYEDLARAFTASDGTRPVVRAKAIEEGFGPKTIKLVVVGTNGTQISSDLRDELEAYFNGDPETGTAGAGQANTEVTVVNYTPRILPVAVVAEATDALSEDLIRTTLATLLSPTVRESNGQTFVWKFGGRVPLSRIATEIFNISPGNVFDVDVTNPSADVELAEDELPLLDSTALVVSITAPKVL